MKEEENILEHKVTIVGTIIEKNEREYFGLLKMAMDRKINTNNLSTFFSI